MKRLSVLGTLAGVVLASGVACAEQEGPQGPGPCGGGPGFGPGGEGRERMMVRGRGEEGGRQEGFRRQQGGRGGPEMGLGMGERLLQNPKRLKEAGATDAQLEELKALMSDQQLKRVDMQAAVEKAEILFKQAMGSDAATEESVLKAFDALSAARTELARQGIASVLKARKVLGADVVKKLREMGPPEGAGGPGRGPRPEGRERPGKAGPAGEAPQRGPQ